MIELIKVLFPLLFSVWPISAEPSYIYPEEENSIPLIGWECALVYDSLGNSIAEPEYKHVAGYGLWIKDNFPPKGIIEYRKSIFIPTAIESTRVLAIYQSAAVNAHEIYWDGNFIGRSGVVGTSRSQEIPGRATNIFQLSRANTRPGEHLIKIRVSNFSSISGTVQEPFRIGFYDNLTRKLYRDEAVALFLAGVFLATALFHLLLMLGKTHRKTYTLFFLLIFSAFLYILLNTSVKYLGISLKYYYTLAVLNDVPWFLMMTTMPLFFMYEFRFRYRKALAVYIVAIEFMLISLTRLSVYGFLPAGMITFFDNFSLLNFYVSIAVSLLINIWSVSKRSTGSASSTLGLLSFATGVFMSKVYGFTYGWLIGLGAMDIFLTISVTNQIAYRNKVFHMNELKNTRLELELLRKHIHPHFLLNSLNSIVAWVEEDVPTAVTLITELSKELRLLLDFSKECFVLLTEEIRLCRTHLKIMSLRYDKKIELIADGVEPTDTIPPLVLHTLVENGLTHGFKKQKEGIFRVSVRRNESVTVFQLFNNGEVIDSEKSEFGGTGFEYIRSRLNEAYGTEWEFDSGAVSDGWLSKIVIHRKVY